MKRWKLTVLAVLLSISQIFAQETSSGDFIRSIGKIYVVIAVIAAVFIGIVLFLIMMERRIAKLEKQIGEN